ncbi:MAG: aspartyl protease family protein [Bacteroidia bacterium]
MRSLFFYFPLLILPLLLPSSVFSRPLETIPFQMVGEHMFIQMVAGENDTLHLIFDTGASTLVINETLVNRLRLSFDREASTTGIGGTGNVRYGNMAKLRAGRISLGEISAIAAPLAHLEAKIGHKIDGIIGYHLLSSFIVRMNFDNRKLEILDQAEFCPEDYGKSHKIDLSVGIPVMNATVSLNDGTLVSGKFLIDSGAGSGLILNTPLVSQRKLTEVSRHTGFQNESSGLNNHTTPFFETVMPGLTFCGYLLQQIPTRLSQSTSGVTAMPEFAGIIGNPVLQRFSLVFDYRQERMYIQAGSRLAHPFTSDASGLKLQLDETLTRIVVEKVIPQSPADKAGVRKGDILTGIDEKPIRPGDLPKVKEQLSRTGKKVILTIERDGKPFPVQILLAQWFM